MVDDLHCLQLRRMFRISLCHSSVVIGSETPAGYLQAIVVNKLGRTDAHNRYGPCAVFPRFQTT